ncbi:MAG: EAL domain-containing protein [Desulfotalea sp.]
MDVFVARQPIFDKKKKIYAYELLFRNSDTNGFPDIDGDTATTSLLSSSFFTVGIDKIGAGKLVFINFTEDLLLKGTPSLFPQDKLVVEILEDVMPTKAIVDCCKELKKKGYILALDDFVYSKKFDELLQLADIVKVDFILTSLADVETMVKDLKPYGCRLLAEKVETYEEFNKALELGFELFQGYFFSKPEILKNKDLSSSQINMMQLISEVNTNDYFDVTKLEKLVSTDISVSYKLLNYLNSSHFSRVQPLTSIRQAISFLGFDDFNRFITLIAASGLAEDKPGELIRASIIRARFMELMAKELDLDGGEMFLLGLFSMIDAILDQALRKTLKKMPLSENINEALLSRSGNLFNFLRLVETYEKGNKVAFKFALKKVGISDDRISELYLEALEWTDSFALV